MLTVTVMECERWGDTRDKGQWQVEGNMARRSWWVESGE